MIKLIKANIIRYKCIETEQSFDVEDDVTVLVGMNESGKTSILEALAKTQYFENDEKFTFNMIHDFPRKQKKSVDKTGEIPDAVKLEYQVDNNILHEIYKELGIKPLNNKFSVTYYYDNHRTWELSWINTLEFMKEKIVLLEFENQDLSSSLQNISNKSQFKKVLENKNEMGYSEDDIKKLDSLKVFFKDTNSWEKSPIDEFVVFKYLIPNLPKFMYYDDYYSLPSRVSLTKLEENFTDSAKKTAKALLELADIDIETLTKSDNFEEFIAELEATEAIISAE